MSLTVNYKGTQIAELTEDGSLTLNTAGKYCEGNILLSASDDVSSVTATYDGNTIISGQGTNDYTLNCAGKIMKTNVGISASVSPVPTIKPYLTFSSSEPFALKDRDEYQAWDGTLYYSTDTIDWYEWDGTEIYSATSENMDYLYLRGSGNTSMGCTFIFNAVDLYCDGNIENLLDWETVANGNHPAMASYCFAELFSGVDCLITAPELPAITLASNCYAYMFDTCTSLTTAPALPATTLASNCYEGMFYGCTSLTTVPALPAITLEYWSYAYMFFYCTQIKLSTTQTGEYQTEYRIPTSGTGTTDGSTLINMFANTGGTFTGTSTINTTYYTSNTVIPAN